MQNHKRLIFKLMLIVLGMLGFVVAMVPFYNVFCKAVGLNGKTGGAVEYQQTNVDKTRTITVEFVATNNENLPWKFYPMTTKIKLHPGEMTRIAYYAENNSPRDMSIQAIPSVTPGAAAKYLKKTECFCFTQQFLKSHDKKEMPVLFHLDPDLPKNINTITLSYTLFDITDRT